MSIKTIKKIGIAATIGGAVLSLVANWAGDKQTEALIDEKVTKKVTDIFASLPVAETVSEVTETN